MLVYIYFIKLHDLNHTTYVSLKAFCCNVTDLILIFFLNFGKGKKNLSGA